MSINIRIKNPLFFIKLSQSLRTSIFAFLILSILLPVFNHSIAQTSTSSPYSRYGIGDLNRGALSQNFALGSSGIAINSPSYINLTNPASYSSFDLTVFEVGIMSNTVRLSTNSLTQITNNASLAYLAFGIPITKWWGTSFGLLPYSSVGYKVNYEEELQNIGTVEYLYEGSGGINKVYLGNAFKIKNRFSFGFNASYLFGSLNKERRVIYDNSQVPFNTKVTNNIVLGDFSFDFGVQYKQKLNEKWNMNLGAVYAYADSIDASRNFIALTYRPGSQFDQIKDTVAYSADEKGKITLPQSLGFGFSLQKGDNWLITADYFMRDWSTYTSFGQSDSLKNSSQASLGAQFIPEPNAVNKYWKAVQYRLGFRYADTYLHLKGLPIQEFGISIGAGLPLRKSRSTINVGLEIGQRGTTENGLIKEQFVNANLGITINDKWFNKRKYD